MTWQKDERGSVIIIVALALTSIMAAVGGAIDFGRAYSARAKMQKAADATALALLSATSSEDPKSMASRFYLNNTAQGDVTSAAVHSQGTEMKSEVAVQAALGTSFMRLFGYSSIPLTVASSAAAPLQVQSVQFIPDTAGGWWEKWVRLNVVRPNGTIETLVSVHYDVTTATPPSALGVSVDQSGWVDLGQFTHAYLEFTIGPKAFDFNQICSGCPTVMRSDDPATSSRFYIDGKQVPAGTKLDIFQFTACDREQNQGWEDGGGWQADITYTVKSKCGAASLAKARLTR